MGGIESQTSLELNWNHIVHLNCPKLSPWNSVVRALIVGGPRDAGGAGLIEDPPNPRPIGAEMGPGLMGHGAGMGIKFIPTAGMGMGMGFR